jgi:hypothetical protein
VWVAPFAGRLSINIDGIALPGASRAGCPNVQLTGMGFVHAPEGAYCGNDFSAVRCLSPALLDDVREQTERVGDLIAGWGFLGHYGLDFVVNERDGRAIAVDLNPRIQGSTPLHTQAERCAARTPLPAVALLVEAGVLSPQEASDAGDFFGFTDGSQLRVQYPGAACSIDDPPRPGVYTREGEWKRPGRTLEEIARDEVLLTGGPPRPGALVEHGSQMFRVYTRSNIVAPPSWAPAPWIERFVGALFAYNNEQ